MKIGQKMSLLKKRLPALLKAWYRQSDFHVRYRSRNQNIYHCTVQKSASQWVRGILSDPRTFRYSGLSSYDWDRQFPGRYDPRKITQRGFREPFPPSSIITPIYIDFEGFASTPKPERYKAFFVMRDPRDVLVSWCFSIKCSHSLLGEIERMRQDLARLSEADGLLYSIDFLADYGLFAAQRSWASTPAQDPNVLLVRHEDLTAPGNLPSVEQVFAHCDIRMPRTVLEEVLEAYSFEKLSGRKPGQEDPSAHYRKAVAGDWRNHFNDKIQARFTEVAGDVVRLWNYA
jgi:hypothetical protein